MSAKSSVQSEVLFENPFRIEDLQVFDDDALREMLSREAFGLTVDLLAQALQEAPQSLVERITHNIPAPQRPLFQRQLRSQISRDEKEQARREVLDNLFWELTYWKTPELYEELTEGERLHPGIFQRLVDDLQKKIVADVGAGSGRASFECLRYGAARVYAIEPSPGLLRILQEKLAQQPGTRRILPHAGRFDAIPLPDHSVDLTLSCSAFTSASEQGGEPGLAEMKRVTRPGGKIVLIWPRREDREWLEARGFHYVALPVREEMRVHFRSLRSALNCAHRFYAHNRAVLQYVLKRKRPEVPFSVIGVNPPCDYCWLEV